MRWVMLFIPSTELEHALFNSPFVICEAPKNPFSAVVLADQQQTGLYAYTSLPRPK